jgi:hypothetical protein
VASDIIVELFIVDITLQKLNTFHKYHNNNTIDGLIAKERSLPNNLRIKKYS